MSAALPNRTWWRAAFSAVLAILVGAVAATVLYLWYALYVQRMAQLPLVQTVESVTLAIPETRTPSSALVIGRIELGQTPGTDSADLRHLALSGPPESPRIANVSSSRLIQYNYEHASFNNLQYPLADGDSFIVAGKTYSVGIDDGARQLTLKWDNGTKQVLPVPYGARQLGLRTWKSHSLSIGGRVDHNPEKLDRPDLVEHLRRLVNRFVFQRPAGQVLIRQDTTAENSVRITLRPSGRFVMTTERDRIIQLCRKSENGACVQLGRQLWPVRAADSGDFGELRSVVLGRTTYGVTVDDRQLTLNPVSRRHWLSQDEIRDLPGETQLSAPFLRGLPTKAVDRVADGSKLAAPMLSAVRSVFAPLETDPLALCALALLAVSSMQWWGWATWRLAALIFTAYVWSVAATPALASTLPLVRDTTGVLALLAVLSGLIWPFSVALFRLIWNVMLGFLKKRSRPALTSQRAKLKSLAFIAGLAAAVLLWVSGPQSEAVGVLARNDALFAAHMAVILGFASTLGLIVLAKVRVRAGDTLTQLFWVSATVVIAFGALSLSHLTLGYRFALHLSLYERHLLALATGAFVTAVAALTPPVQILDLIKSILSQVYRGHWWPRWVALVLLLFIVIAPLGYLAMQAMGGWKSAVDKLTQKTGMDPVTVLALAVVVLACFLFAGWAALKSKRVKRWLRRPFAVPSLLLALPSLLLGSLVLVTPEAGFAGVQPSELAKTWLAILLALILAASLERREWMLSFEKGRSILTVFAFYMLVAGFFGLGSLINFDLSPIAIIGVMTIASATVLLVFYGLTSLPVLFQIILSVVLIALVFSMNLKDTVTASLVVAIFLLTLMYGRWTRPSMPLPTIAQFRAPWYRGVSTGRRKMLAEGVVWLRKHLSAIPLTIALIFVIFLSRTYMPTFTSGEPERFLDTLGTRVAGVSLDVPVERAMSFVDASIYREPGDDGRLIIAFPDLSHQVRRSREVVAASGCGFWNSVAELPDNSIISTAKRVRDWSRLDKLADRGEWSNCPQTALFPFAGAIPATVSRVPALQDDFAATFLVGSLGTDAAAMLIFAQCLMLGAMVAIAIVSGIRLSASPSFRGIGVFGAIAVGNLAIILFCQFALSWLNMLGLFAVVGQPMTFASLGASHHIAFALPALALTVTVALVANPANLRVRSQQPLIPFLTRNHWSEPKTR